MKKLRVVGKFSNDLLMDSAFNLLATLATDGAQNMALVEDNGFLNAAQSQDGNGYAVFGKVVAGMDVVDKIRVVPTGNKGPHQNVPNEPVTITKATVEK